MAGIAKVDSYFLSLLLSNYIYLTMSFYMERCLWVVCHSIWKDVYGLYVFLFGAMSMACLQTFAATRVLLTKKLFVIDNL